MLRTAQGEAAGRRTRRRAEHAERASCGESQEQYRFLAETLPALVWSSRADGTLDYHNARSVRVHRPAAGRRPGPGRPRSSTRTTGSRTSRTLAAGVWRPGPVSARVPSPSGRRGVPLVPRPGSADARAGRGRGPVVRHRRGHRRPEAAPARVDAEPGAVPPADRGGPADGLERRRGRRGDVLQPPVARVHRGARRARPATGGGWPRSTPTTPTGSTRRGGRPSPARPTGSPRSSASGTRPTARTGGSWRSPCRCADPDGTVDQWVGSLTDIDDQKRHAADPGAAGRPSGRPNCCAGGRGADAGPRSRSAATAVELRRSNERAGEVRLRRLATTSRSRCARSRRSATGCGRKYRDELGDQGQEYVDRMLDVGRRGCGG